MKFRPKALTDNVNISKTHPLVELSWLLGGLLFLAGFLFVILGLATDLAVSKTPISIENWMGEKIIGKFQAQKSEALQKRLDAILNTLPKDSSLQEHTFTLYLSDQDEINAFALPGGNVVVTAGLLRQVESENELAMVLCHELGHFAHRDHLRGLGRGLGVSVVFAMLFGRDSAATDLVSRSLLSFQVNYSKDQEVAADSFGLDLLNHHYGHVGGGIDFFARLSSQKGEGRLPYLLASHPHPEVRINHLKRLIDQNGYMSKVTVPFDNKVKKDVISGSSN